MSGAFQRDEDGRFAPLQTPYPEGLTADEAENLFWWRSVCLRRAGFDSRSARALALDFEADLRLAVELLDRGCPQDTALRIVL